jgi:hypothetical protein
MSKKEFKLKTDSEILFEILTELVDNGSITIKLGTEKSGAIVRTASVMKWVEDREKK